MHTKKKKRLLLGILLVFGYIGLFVLGEKLYQMHGAKVAIVFFATIATANLLYSLFYFINEFRYDQILVGRLDLAESTRIQARKRYLTWYWMLLVNTSQLFLFAFLFQYFYKLGADKYFTYSRPLHYFDWVLYTLDCTFKSILDIPEIFHWQLRNIKHVGFTGGMIVLVIRTLIYTMLATAVLRQFKKWVQRNETLHALNVAPDVAGRRFLRMGEEALPALAKAMTKPNMFKADVKQQEILLRNEHTEPILQLLLRNLRVGNDVERKNASVLFGLFAIQDPSSPPYWSDLLQHIRQEPIACVRAEIVRSLGKIGDRRVLVSLRPLLRSPYPQVREYTARVFGYMKDVNAIRGLASCLEDSVPEVRLAAARALGRIGSHHARTFLKQALGHDDPQVQREIVFSLAHLGDRSVTEQLISIVRHQKEDLKARLKAIQFLWELRSPEATEALLESLADTEPEVRREATRALADIAPKEAALHIIEGSKETDPSVRRAHVALMMVAKEPKALPYLEEAIQDEEPLIREQAYQVLGAYETEEAAQILLKSLENNPSTEDKINAVRALGLSKQAFVYDKLLPIAQKEKNPHLKQQAIYSLTWLNPKRAESETW